jgi:hypothetical protein
MRALTHLFGSVDGYRTLARSPGITDSEDAALAALGFGSPRNEEEFAQLEASPCMAGRLLPSGRYAITRIFPGPVDVAGRRTVERRTLILDTADWANLATSGVADTLADEANWNRAAFADAAPIDVRARDDDDLMPSATESDRRVFDALLTAHAVGRCAALPAGARWNASVMRLVRLLPREQAMLLGWGVGLWSVPSGVWVATMRTAGASKSTFTAPTAGAWRHPEQVMGLGHGLTKRDSEPAPRRMPRRAIDRRAWLAAAATAMLLLVLLGVRTLLPGARKPDAAPRADRHMSMAESAGSSSTKSAATPPGVLSTDAGSEAAGSGAEASTGSTRPASDLQPTMDVGGGRATTGPASSPPTFGGRSAELSGFGSGTTIGGTSTGSADAETAQSEPTSTAPISEERSPSRPTETPEPEIPAITAPSTPWDVEVRLLTDAVDLHERVLGLADLDRPAARQALNDLAMLAGRLHAQYKADSERDWIDANDSRLIYIDNRGKQRGLTPTMLELRHQHSIPPVVYRRMALLSARFEVSLALQSLVQRAMVDPDALPTTLASDGKASGWPSNAPWRAWYYRDERESRSTAAQGAVYMADEILERFLKEQPGTRSLQEQLRRIRDGLRRNADSAPPSVPAGAQPPAGTVP